MRTRSSFKPQRISKGSISKDRSLKEEQQATGTISGPRVYNLHPLDRMALVAQLSIVAPTLQAALRVLADPAKEMSRAALEEIALALSNTLDIVLNPRTDEREGPQDEGETPRRL